MSLFSSKNASPVFGFVLKRAAPVNTSCFWDLLRMSSSGAVNSCERHCVSAQIIFLRKIADRKPQLARLCEVISMLRNWGGRPNY
jgi:hypothetical protein